MAEETDYWGQLSGSLVDGASKIFSEGLPKYFDAEIGVPYQVQQPSNTYETAPNGVTQRAGIVQQSSITSSPWFIVGLIAAGVAVILAVKN